MGFYKRTSCLHNNTMRSHGLLQKDGLLACKGKLHGCLYTIKKGKDAYREKSHGLLECI